MQNPDEWFPIVAQGCVALAAAMLIWLRAKGPDRVWWLEYTLLLGGALLAGLLVWRSMAFVGVLGAVPLGWLASRLLEAMRQAEEPLRKLAVAIMLVLVLQPGVPVVTAKAVMKDRAPSLIGNTVSRLEESSCSLAANLPALAKLPKSTIFAPVDIGPDILLRTPHSVVATGHHRAQAAMHDVIQAFIGPEAQAHAIVQAPQSRLCGRLHRSGGSSQLFRSGAQWADGAAW